MPILTAAPAFALRHHIGRQLEAQEVHRRRLLLVLALQVFVGDGEHALEARDLHPAAVLDSLQRRRA